MGSGHHSIAVCMSCCADDRKAFYIIIQSLPLKFMATVANGALRLTIGLRLV